MAHALPQLIAPVDREYTLKLLFGHGRIRNDSQAEWNTLRSILQGFFYPVAISADFVAKAQTWMVNAAVFKWDTSPLKVVDNLLIGLQKRTSAEQAVSPAAGLAPSGRSARRR